MVSDSVSGVALGEHNNSTMEKKTVKEQQASSNETNLTEAQLEEDFSHDEKAFRLHYHREGLNGESSVQPEFAHQVILDDFSFREQLFKTSPSGEATDDPEFLIHVRYTPLWRAYLDVSAYECDQAAIQIADFEEQKSQMVHELYKSIVFPADTESGENTLNRTTSSTIFNKWVQEETKNEAVDMTHHGAKLVQRYEQTDSLPPICIWEIDCKDPKGMALFDRAQCMATWFIETASLIDCTDQRWSVLVVTEEQMAKGEDKPFHSLAGFASVFEFTNPCRGDKPHILRVCQFLVVPHLQGKGVAEKLLSAAYCLATRRNDVYEMTVETPNERFSRLRDAVDCRVLLDQDHGDRFGFSKLFLSGENASSMNVDHSTTKRVKLAVPSTEPPVELAKEILEKAHSELKLTLRQITRCYELLQYGYHCAQLSKHRVQPLGEINLGATTDQGDRGSQVQFACYNFEEINSPEIKDFRLAVKRRLFRENVEELSIIESKEDMKKRLSELYQETQSEFQKVLKRLKLFSSAF